MVWVSGTTGRLGSASHVLYQAFLREEITVVTSGPLVNELAETLINHLGRPADAVEAFIALLCARAEVIAIQHQVMGCRDPDDDPVLETAVTGNADILVTRDRRLLNLTTHVAKYMERCGIRMMPPEIFAEMLRDMAS